MNDAAVPSVTAEPPVTETTGSVTPPSLSQTGTVTEFCVLLTRYVVCLFSVTVAEPDDSVVWSFSVHICAVTEPPVNETV